MCMNTLCFDIRSWGQGSLKGYTYTQTLIDIVVILILMLLVSTYLGFTYLIGSLGRWKNVGGLVGTILP